MFLPPIAVVTFVAEPLLKVFCALWAMTVFFVAHLVARPFADDVANYIEIAASLGRFVEECRCVETVGKIGRTNYAQHTTQRMHLKAKQINRRCHSNLKKKGGGLTVIGFVMANPPPYAPPISLPGLLPSLSTILVTLNMALLFFSNTVSNDWLFAITIVCLVMHAIFLVGYATPSLSLWNKGLGR